MNPRFVLAQAWFTGIRALRSTYPSMISSLGFPLSLLFVIGIVSGGTLVSFALVGGLIAIIANVGIYTIGDLGVYKFDFMFKDLIVTTKTSPIDYMTAVVAANVLWASPGLALYFILDIVYKLLTPYAFVMSIIVAAFVLISTASIAFVVSSFIKHIRNIWSIAGILTVLLTALPPTFYPYTYLPKTALTILMIFPTTTGAVLEQGIFGLEPMIWSAFYVLIAEAVVLFLLAKYLTVWRER